MSSTKHTKQLGRTGGSRAALGPGGTRATTAARGTCCPFAFHSTFFRFSSGCETQPKFAHTSSLIAFKPGFAYNPPQAGGSHHRTSQNTMAIHALIGGYHNWLLEYSGVFLPKKAIEYYALYPREPARKPSSPLYRPTIQSPCYQSEAEKEKPKVPLEKARAERL